MLLGREPRARSDRCSNGSRGAGCGRIFHEWAVCGKPSCRAFPAENGMGFPWAAFLPLFCIGWTAASCPVTCRDGQRYGTCPRVRWSPPPPPPRRCWMS
eukprot:4067692-Heterocapsa_arctica.AAC.1